MLFNAWRQVPALSVSKCFRKAGFTEQLTLNDDDDFDQDDDSPLSRLFDDESDDDDDVPIAQLIAKLHDATGNEGELPSVHDFVHVDDDVIATSEMTDDDIVSSISDTDYSDDDDDDTSNSDTALPSVNQIDAHLSDLERFIESQELVPDGIFDSFAILKEFVQSAIGKSHSQSKITDFFSR